MGLTSRSIGVLQAIACDPACPSDAGDVTLSVLFELSAVAGPPVDLDAVWRNVGLHYDVPEEDAAWGMLRDVLPTLVESL